jgi:peptide/nickel transport system permease protein
MTRFLLHRLSQSILVILVVSTLIFFGVFLIGDPTTLLIPPEANQATVNEVKRSLGLDLPMHQQYLRFLANAIQGDLGRSYVFRVSALVVIFERLPATLELAFSAMFIAVVIGVPLGMLAGCYPDSWVDRTLMIGSTFGFSVPTFWAGLLFILLFSVNLGWLPASGRGDTVSVYGVHLSLLTLDGLTHLLLPAFNLAVFPLAFIIRLTRSGMREAIGLDFVRFALAQGNTRWQVIRIYVLKFISIPIVTLVGMYLGVLIAFAVVTESVYSWPGTGKLIIDSINVLDRPVIIAYIMVTVLVFSIINLIVDILYSVLDPRIRTE